MKPRRWYSSPEPDPNPTSPARPFPDLVYWDYTMRAYREQGPIIKSASAAAAATGGREVGVRLTPPRLRLIDAA